MDYILIENNNSNLLLDYQHTLIHQLNLLELNHTIYGKWIQSILILIIILIIKLTTLIIKLIILILLLLIT
jgi:hypothetical protein